MKSKDPLQHASYLYIPGITQNCWDRGAMRFLFIFSNWKWFPSKQHGFTIQKLYACPPFNAKSVSMYQFIALATFAMATFILLLILPGIDKLNNTTETESNH